MKRLLIPALVVLLALVAGAGAVLFGLAVFFSAAAPEDPVLSSLPAYESREFYSSGGFQDYTDYGKYHYSLPVDLSDNPLLRPVTEADLPVISGYLDNFENWVAISSDFPKESYDFARAVLRTGGYFYIENPNTEPEKRYWDYTLYYFDPNSGILYYFHSNI